ncbi:MAG: hypothetical protein FWD86_02850, partial [Firmicutes bacterium]|nr:hypothetical protein [Bacillota bacterium]
MAKYFGTDGIRGVAGEGLTLELSYRVGAALCIYFGSDNFVVGTDTRASSNPLKSALKDGVKSVSPCKRVNSCLDCGVIPTPAVSLLVKKTKAAFGVMITASHNPPQFNGIKVFGSEGKKLTKRQEDGVESLIDRPPTFVRHLINPPVSNYGLDLHKIEPSVSSFELGLDKIEPSVCQNSSLVRSDLGEKKFVSSTNSKLKSYKTKSDYSPNAFVSTQPPTINLYEKGAKSQTPHITPYAKGTKPQPPTINPYAKKEYIEFLLSSVKNKRAFKKLKILLDCGHGAASTVAADVFKRLGAAVVSICDRGDGRLINQNCGALHAEDLAKSMPLFGDFDLGFAFDGDADRLSVIMDGQVLDADSVLYSLSRCDSLSGERGVVGTIMANSALENALKADRKVLFRTAVGDKYVAREMERLGLKLGGEQSGHFIFGGLAGDGIYAALRFCQVFLSGGARRLDLFPQVTVSVDC